MMKVIKIFLVEDINQCVHLFLPGNVRQYVEPLNM